MVLHIIVAVKYVVFPVVLVLGRYHDLAETAPEFRSRMYAKVLAGVGISAPGGVALRLVLNRLPVSFVDCPQDTGTVGTRLATKNSVEGGITLCLGLIGAFLFARRLVALVFFQVPYDHIVLRGFIQGSYQLHCLVDQFDQVRKCVPKESANSHCDIYTRTA